MKKSVSKKVSKKSVKKSTLDMSALHTNDDVKGYIGFVCERFENQVSAVAEQFLGLNQKVDVLGEKVDVLGEKVDVLGEKVDNLEGRMSGVELRLGGVEQRLDTVEQKLDEHTEILNAHTDMYGKLMITVEEIKTGLSQKVEREEFNKLEMRLVTLESIVYSGREGKSTEKRK